jgi:hypothetical protein
MIVILMCVMGCAVDVPAPHEHVVSQGLQICGTDDDGFPIWCGGGNGGSGVGVCRNTLCDPLMDPVSKCVSSCGYPAARCVCDDVWSDGMCPVGHCQ